MQQEIIMNIGTISRLRLAAISAVLAVLTLCGNGVPLMPAAEPAKDDKAGNKGPVIQSPLAEKWDYEAPMKKVAARFKGKEGVVIHVGASDTIANPYTTWARSGKG